MVSSGSHSAAEQGRTLSPRRTTTRHQFAPRGTWDRAAIVGAARAWAEETGAPPRSWEWCPSSARSAGLIGGAEHRWEREHPRWPGNTTVYRFFPSWGDLLEAAGLPPYQRRLPGPLADRIAAVRLLHDAGLTNKRVAAELRLNAGTVSRYLRAGTCRSCGGPVVGGGERCQPCATRRANPRRWSPEEVVEAVEAWAVLEGRPPLTTDWRPAPSGSEPNRWEREFPRWPPASVGRITFGSWNAMLVEAGERAYNLRWERDDVLDALRAFGARHRRAPTKTELESPPTGMPSAPTVRRTFGSFTAGLRAAGLEPTHRRWSDEEIFVALRAFRAVERRWPTSGEWQRATPDHPSAAGIARRFGGWRRALAAAEHARP